MTSIFHYFPFLAIFTLLLAALIIFLFKIFRVKFPYVWLISTFTIVVAWVLVLLSRGGMPYIVDAAQLLTVSENLGIPSLFIDTISWSLALTLISFSLVVYFTLVIYPVQMDWLSLMGGLVMTAFVLSITLARDVMWIMASWAVIDFMEFILLFFRIKEKDRIEGLIKNYSMRIISMMLFLWGMSDTSVLIIAATLRLMIIPAGNISPKEIDLPKSMLYFLSMISPASSMIVFSRISLTTTTGQYNPIFLVLFLVLGLFTAIQWFLAKDAFEGRRYWILTIGLFSGMAALRGLPIASISWGITLLLGGGILFFEERTSRKPLFSYVGLLAITSLPFMPTWDGASLYTTVPNYSLVLLVISQSLVVAGYFKHLNARDSEKPALEPWVKVIDSGRMLLMIGVYWLIAYLLWRDGILLSNSAPVIMPKQIIDYYIGLIVVIVSLLMLIFDKSQNRFVLRIKPIIMPKISMTWVKKAGESIFRFLGSVMEGISSLIEGESGILLTLLLLALVITFFILGG